MSGAGARSNGNSPPPTRQRRCGRVPRRASCARARCSTASSRAPTSTSYVEERLLDHDARAGRQLGARQRVHARLLRPRLLRDRDDGRGQPAHGHRALRLRGVPRLAAPGRPDDHLGPRSRSRWRRSSGASTTRCSSRKLGDRDGRVLLVDRASSTTTRSWRPTSSCRSTCTSRAARRGRRRSSTASSSCAPWSWPSPTQGWRSRYGGRGTEEFVESEPAIERA